VLPNIEKQIASARDHLAVAERELESALGELSRAERADKQMVTSRIQKAFSELAEARRRLDSLLAPPA
jgi:hypothetical protein